MTSCYDCIHQSVCFIHKGLKSSVQDPLLPKKAEWYEQFFTFIKDACIKFEPHEGVDDD